MRLYELPGELRLWEEAVEGNGGEVTEELALAYEHLGQTLVQKADSIACLIREAEAEELGYRNEARTFQSKAQASKNRAESLKGYLLANMKLMGVDAVQGPRFAVSKARAGTPAISWAHGGEIPEGYRKVKVELDSLAAHDAYKRGELPEGFAVHHTEYLRIR